MTPKQAKRLDALLKNMNRVIGLMNDAEMRPFVDNWNVSSLNIRESLIEFVDWQAKKIDGSAT